MVDVRRTHMTHRGSVAVPAGLLIFAALSGCAHGTHAGAAPQGRASLPDPLATSEQWTRAEAITRVVHVNANQRTLTVLTVVGGCKNAELRSHETPSVIRLAIQIKFNKPVGEVCTADAVLISVHTTLKATLHGRKVVDATTGRTLVVNNTRP